MVPLGTNLLVGGGRTYSTAVPYPLMTVYNFDTTARKWRDTHPRGAATVPTPREGFTAAAWGDDKMVLFGGYNSRALTTVSEFNDVFVLNAGTSQQLTQASHNPQWADLTVTGRNYVPKERQGASCVVIGNTAWVFGGSAGPRYFNDTHALRLSPGLSAEDTSFIDIFLATSENAATEKKSKDGEVIEKLEMDKTGEKDDKEGGSVVTGSGLPVQEGLRGRLKWALDNEKTFPDVAFSIKGVMIYAHKVVLAARSVVFRKKFDPSYGSSRGMWLFPSWPKKKKKKKK
jgi:N-acetylneuraminic acid mutarotase